MGGHGWGGYSTATADRRIRRRRVGSVGRGGGGGGIAGKGSAGGRAYFTSPISQGEGEGEVVPGMEGGKILGLLGYSCGPLCSLLRVLLICGWIYYNWIILTDFFNIYIKGRSVWLIRKKKQDI